MKLLMASLALMAATPMAASFADNHETHKAEKCKCGCETGKECHCEKGKCPNHPKEEKK